MHVLVGWFVKSVLSSELKISFLQVIKINILPLSKSVCKCWVNMFKASYFKVQSIYFSALGLL